MMYLHVYMNMNSQELKNNKNIKWTLKKKKNTVNGLEKQNTTL